MSDLDEIFSSLGPDPTKQDLVDAVAQLRKLSNRLDDPQREIVLNLAEQLEFLADAFDAGDAPN